MVKKSASAVWNYSTMFQDKLEIAKCNIAVRKLEEDLRVLQVKKISTKSLKGHLKSKHKNEHSLAEKERSKETEKKKILKKQEEKF